MMLSFYICYFRDVRVNETTSLLRYLSDDLLPSQPPSRCIRVLLTLGVGLGIDQMQAPHEPLWPYWLYQHRHRLPRWFALCLRRQRRDDNAMGLE